VQTKIFLASSAQLVEDLGNSRSSSTGPQDGQTRSFARLGPSAGMCGGIRAHVEMEFVRKPESPRMRRKSVSERKLIFPVPMVRIHFPPAGSRRLAGFLLCAETTVVS